MIQPPATPIQTFDESYEDRNLLALLAADLAAQAGYTIGFGEDLAEPEWPVLFIDLPQGQISYHLPKALVDQLPISPDYQGRWDGHDTPEKRRRIMSYLTGVEEE